MDNFADISSRAYSEHEQFRHIILPLPTCRRRDKHAGKAVLVQMRACGKMNVRPESFVARLGTELDNRRRG